MASTARQDASAAARDSDPRPAEGSAGAVATRPQRRWLALAAGLLVCGVRLALVARLGGDAPYLDECNQTGWYQIWAGEHSLTFSWLVAPHMEHRLVTQRLFSLALAGLNGGQWDVRVELVAATALWGLLAAGLAWAGLQRLAGWRAFAWCGLVLLAETIPHAWENLLWAFQVQFVFLVGFSALALWWLTQSRPLSARWWCGLLAGALACLSQASGLLAWIAAGFVGLLLALRHTRDWRRWAALALLAAAVGAGVWATPMRPPNAAAHAAGLATSWQAWTSLLAWPWSPWPWFAAAIWLPGLAWSVRALRRRDGPAVDAAALALLVWSALQCAAIAWARGDLLAHDVPPSRYGDVLIVGVLANGWALLRLVPSDRHGRAIATAWLLTIVAGCAFYTADLAGRPTRASTLAPISLRSFAASRQIHAEAFRVYVRTGDATALDVKPPIYPVATHLAEIVDRLRAVHRWPSRLDKPGARPPWLSRVGAHAGFLAWATLAGGIAAGAMTLRARPREPR